NRRVRKTEFLFHPIDFAFTAYKGHNEIEMLGCEMCKWPTCKLTFDGSITRWAMQTADRQF
ncbi:MAG TPA: hypothetical protein VJ327_00690, partial [Patescibacteria group bacterium]|nr:hypothetical protein [Patescibacteria group bacterium]